jgi:endoglucanase
MKILKHLCLATALLSATSSYSQGFLKADGTRIVNEKGENVLLRGIGLGGWMLQEGYMLHVPKEQQQHRIKARLAELVGEEKMEAFYDAWLRNNTRKTDIDSLKAWGFNSVRLPMHYQLYDTDKGFAMTDSLVAWCKADHIYLILDLHAAPGGQGNDLNIADRDGSKPALWDSPADQQKTVALWKKLAQRYKDEPTIGGYDILNEPNFGFDDKEHDPHGTQEKTNAPLKKLMQEITAAIREVDTKHIIIIEGNAWGNNYNGVLPPWDKNMVLSFHKYWNFNDLHSIQHILDLRKQYNVPVWLGETGENSNVWFTEAVRLLESNNIGWSWWPLKKMGINNPLEIPSNANYQQIINYWSGKGPQPSADDAYKGIMQLANDAKTENNIVHRDVIDAMFRQPWHATAIPFKNNSIRDGAIIQAADYDLGANGIAYFDTDTLSYRVSDPKINGGNQGHAYRNDGVDIAKHDDSIFVTDIETSEWLQYTIYPKQKGSYKLVITYSGDGVLAVQNDSKQAGADVTLHAGDEWKTVTVPLTLKDPVQRLRLYAKTGGYELKEIKFEKMK